MADTPLRVVAVVAHPDDESYSMSATLYHAARSGAQVSVLCATRGERGEDFSGSGGDLASRRTAELAGGPPTPGDAQ